MEDWKGIIVMKKQYEIPRIDVEVLNSSDVIWTSGGGNNTSNNKYDKDGDGFVDGWY